MARLVSAAVTSLEASSTQANAGTFSTPANTGAWWAAYGADRNVNVGGSGASQTWFNGKNINLGYATATNMVTLVNALNLNTVSRNVVVIRGLGSIDGRLSGVVADNGSPGIQTGLNVSGTGILALTGANTFTGNVIVGGTATVIANSVTNSGTTASSIGKGTYGIALAGGTFQYAPVVSVGGGGATINRNFAISASSSLDASGTGALVFNQTGPISPDLTALSFTAPGNSKVITLTSVNTNSYSTVPSSSTLRLPTPSRPAPGPWKMSPRSAARTAPPSPSSASPMPAATSGRRPTAPPRPIPSMKPPAS